MSEQSQNQIQQTTIVADVPPNVELMEVRKAINNITEKLNSLDNEITTSISYINKIKALVMIFESIGMWKCSTCKMNINGVCTGWRLPSNLSNNLANLLGEDIVIQQDNVYRFKIDKFPFIGSICPIYIQRL